MAAPSPTFAGGWLTGRFVGHYVASGAGLVRGHEGRESRPLRILRGTLEDARFAPFAPPPAGLRQDVVPRVWVRAGVKDGEPAWIELSLEDVRLTDWEVLAEELYSGDGIGEIAGTFWGRVPGGDDVVVGEPEPVPA